MPSNLYDFIIWVAVGAAVFGVVHANANAFGNWAREALKKLVGWTEAEAKTLATSAQSRLSAALAKAADATKLGSTVTTVDHGNGTVVTVSSLPTDVSASKPAVQ